MRHFMIHQQLWRKIFLGAGISVLILVVELTASASQSTLVQTEQALAQYWRTSYDILVRPPGARSSIEEKFGLLEMNYLLSQTGNISLEQYEWVKDTPGVAVAAPIAVLTNLDVIISPKIGGLRTPDEPGVYLAEGIFTIDEGYRLLSIPYAYTYNYVGPEPTPEIAQEAMKNGILINSRVGVADTTVPMWLVAIDPVQEANLVNLDEAMTKGEYLDGKTTLHSTKDTGPFGNPFTLIQNVPVLVNAHPYIQYVLENRIKSILVPQDVSSLEEILARGGKSYLDGLPSETTNSESIDSENAFGELVERIWKTGSLQEDEFFLYPFKKETISKRSYQEISPPLNYDHGVVLEVTSPTKIITEQDNNDPELFFSMEPKGVFDIEGIPDPEDVNEVPLNTYFPPSATLLFSNDGNFVEPTPLYPSFDPAGYIPRPPLLLTTLEAARVLAGDNCISAIRVRVAGIDQLNSQTQRKIEAVASEIHHRTGLDVDIMVGSSPTQVLVYTPGVGYVEEEWVQKNVTFTYKKRVQSGHLLLLGVLLGVGGLFTVNLTWADVASRRREIAVQKALGWYSITVFMQVLRQNFFIGVLAVVLGSLLAWGMSHWLNWILPTPMLLVTVSLAGVGLTLLGSLYPAWLASRILPIAGIQRSGLRYRRTINQRSGVIRLRSYAWYGLTRRWSHTTTNGLSMGISAVLLTLLLGVTMEQQGYLSGTLLGEYILARIEGYHYTIVGIGFGLAAISTANSLLSSVLERRREIGVLKAIGWRTGAVARLFLTEGLLLGTLGGLAGTVLGLGIFASLYRSLPPGLAWAAAAGILVPALVGVLAAIYPAWQAARIPPAEAVRYE